MISNLNLINETRRDALKQSIATDATKLTIAKSLTLIISLVSVMLLSRFRTLDEYGTYSQLLMVVNLTTTIFMLGLPNSINFFLARAESDEERQEFLSVYYSLSTFLSFITGLVLVLSASLIVKYFDNALIKNFIYVLALFPWASIILSSIQNVFIVYQKSTQLMLFTVLNSVFLLLIIVVVEIFNWDFNMYMFLFVLVNAVFAISVYIIAKNLAGKLSFVLDKALVQKILEFSIPLGLASVVGTLSIELGKIFIGKFYDTAEFAIYTNAAKELPVTIIAVSLTAVLMPQLVRLLKDGKNAKAIGLWGDATTLSYIFICFFATGFFVYAPDVISLLYSDKFLPGVSVFRIYCVVLILRCTYFGMILNSIGRTKFIFYSSIAALLLNALLIYPCYVLFGFIGPAIASFLSLAAVQFMQLIATSKSVDISFRRIFPWKSLTIITLVNIFMGLLFYFIKDAVSIEIITNEIIESIVLGFVWGILYFIVMLKPIKQKWRLLNA